MAITGEASLVQQLLAKALIAYRERFSIMKNVRFLPADRPMRKNETVRFPRVEAFTVGDVVPGKTASNNGDFTTNYRDISLAYWRDANFTLDDTQYGNFNDKLVSENVTRCMEALVLDVESKVQALYKQSYAYVGTAATTPFASDVSVAIAARKVMNTMNVPMMDRVMMLGPDAEANAINLNLFLQANTSGSTQTIMEGQLGRKLGFDWHSSNIMPTHTNTGGAGYLVNGASQTGTALIVDTGSTPPVAGDVFTIAGDTQTYVVDSVAGTTWSIWPAIATAPADNAAITFKATHAVNFAYHRDAIGLTMAPFAAPPEGASISQVQSIVDPDTGVPIRLEITRESKQWRFTFDILYGTALLYRDGMVRVAG